MLLLIGPAVAVIGIVAVVFVMRHKSVEKRSMYSARRSQIEHKVRAARQRTLAPTRRAEKSEKGSIEQTSSAAPAMTYQTSAYASPPVAPPPPKTTSAQSWDTGPVTTPVDTPAFTPPAPAYEPPPAAPAYEPPPAAPAYEPPPAQPAYKPPPFEAPEAKPEWTPAPPAQLEPERVSPAATSAAAGASWSVVGETKASADPEPAPKKKASKDAQTGAWQLASGEVAGDEADEGPRKPSTLIAVAQYAVLVVGLVMVLIGVVVMVANSHGN
ncbi:MAG: hypothetical protein QOI23_2411 [Chloroflexota bacterium]|nr:hypothetical protein [Chloroflexota bacterium]